MAAGEASPQSLWETLEIEAEQPDKLLASYTFVLRVYSDEGSYEYGRREFGGTRHEPIEFVTGSHRAYAQNVLNDIDKYLVKEGWQRLPRGVYWYSNRYRRLIDPEDLDTYLLSLEIAHQGAFRQTVRWVARAKVGQRIIAASSEFTMGKRLKPNDPAAIKALDELNTKLEGRVTFSEIDFAECEPELPTE